MKKQFLIFTLFIIIQSMRAMESQEQEKLDLQLWYPAKAFNEELVQHLLEIGADPVRHAPNRIPTLYLIANYCYEPSASRICKQFLAYGADPNIEFFGTTPLIAAAKTPNGDKSEQKTCWLLLHHGADPNRQDKEGNTALMHTGNENICNMLLQAKANVFIRNNMGDSALHCAARKRNKSMLKMIMEHAQKDKSLVTLLACMKNHALATTCAVYELQRKHHLLTPHLMQYTFTGLLQAKNNEGKSFEDLWNEIK